MDQSVKQHSDTQITCPHCDASMTHSKRTRFERDSGYDIEKLKCEQCGFEMPNLIGKDSK